MPSSKKTPNLRLNQWLGSDKPKKDDFNEDNAILDQSLGQLRVDMEQAVLGNGRELAQAREEIGRDIEDRALGLARYVDNQNQLQSDAIGLELEGLRTSLEGTISGHGANASIHTTQAEKNAWTRGLPTVGSFVGNGEGSRKLTLGFPPSAGMVFALSRPMVKATWADNACEVYAAMFAKDSAGGVSVQSDGFTVVNNAAANVEGFCYRLNQQDVVYTYLLWR